MINGGYLIPANTKKGQLILGIFTPGDLIMFAVSLVVSVMLLLIVGTDKTFSAILCLMPALICGFLVLPIPNYRNVKTFIGCAIEFLTKQRIYKWRGWCFYGQSDRK